MHLAFDGDGRFLAGLAGVVQARIETNVAELRLEAGSDPQGVLQAAVGRLRVNRFEVASPSLEEIFIDRVGAGAEGEGRAAAGEAAS